MNVFQNISFILNNNVDWLDKDAYDMLYNNGYYAMRVT